MDDHDERVQQRAYKIWMEEGCPDGRSQVHWEMARELVAIEENLKLTLKPVPPEGAEAPGGEPVEEAAIVANTGELPTIVDQGEQAYPPSRSNLEKAGDQKPPRARTSAASQAKPKRTSKKVAG